jgi:hypothetical protein
MSEKFTSCKRNFFLVFLALFSLAFCGAAFAAEGDGYVRLAIKGTNINLRPLPRAAGGVVAQMNTGDVFIAEKWPITCEDDNSEWYKIVLPATNSGKIKALCDWDKRFKANVAFVSAKFASVSPLKPGEMGRIQKTPVDVGYSFDLDPDTGGFDAIIDAGLVPFQSE